MGYNYHAIVSINNSNLNSFIIFRMEWLRFMLHTSRKGATFTHTHSAANMEHGLKFYSTRYGMIEQEGVE